MKKPKNLQDWNFSWAQKPQKVNSAHPSLFRWVGPIWKKYFHHGLKKELYEIEYSYPVIVYYSEVVLACEPGNFKTSRRDMAEEVAERCEKIAAEMVAHAEKLRALAKGAK